MDVSWHDPQEIAKDAPELLAYPTGDRAAALRTARELKALGVEAIALEGETAINGLRVLGKGKSSIVLKCSVRGELAAAKVRRIDAPVIDLKFEGAMLRAANHAGVGPELVGWDDDVLLMELLIGIPLATFLRNGEAGVDELRRTLSLALDKARALDAAHIDHGELHNPGDHVLVTPEGPEILDFGSASASRRPANVTSLASAIARTMGRIPDDSLVQALKKYKEEMDDRSYQVVLEELGIQ
ncbi:serine/threonine protein kinase [Conexivisphaera calida]|uniref:Serine/threonine protein kinase n=1 Tax=Conexivisphaera calida TaxID=1874277 RepID=A0A4P2VJI6_9ARCH|nr:serine/threonine protein kinase [Conexivisphaera calida]BBE41515.1 hypothetical protein NAS2_0109 [Conexivisphaera calida]